MPTEPNAHSGLALLKELLAVPAPSGREERLASVVRARLDRLGYAHETDGSGNVSVRVPGRDADRGLMVLASHLDEIGVVVTHIESDGRLGVDRSGGLFPYKIGECPVEIVGDRETIPGLLAMGSTHTPGAESRSIAWSDVRIVTGLSPERLAAVGVCVGSTAVPAAFVRGPMVFGDPADPLVAAWTFDDRLGVVTLLRLLEAMRAQGVTPIHPIVIAFTVHEEGGAHGAKVLAQRERPELFVAVDGCPMPPGTPLVLDGRPAAWSKDQVTHFDTGLIQSLTRAAREAGTDLQTVVYERAMSDASAAYNVGAAARVATVGHVRDNSHGYEFTRLSAFDHLLNTLTRFVTYEL